MADTRFNYCPSSKCSRILKIFETEIRGKKFEQYDDTIIGYAKDGTKIIETKVIKHIFVVFVVGGKFSSCFSVTR